MCLHCLVRVISYVKPELFCILGPLIYLSIFICIMSIISQQDKEAKLMIEYKVLYK